MSTSDWIITIIVGALLGVGSYLIYTKTRILKISKWILYPSALIAGMFFGTVVNYLISH